MHELNKVAEIGFLIIRENTHLVRTKRIAHSRTKGESHCCLHKRDYCFVV